MDPGSRTHLLDFFRRGDVARDIRLLAARGALAPRAFEQLALLVYLVEDPDPDVAWTAEETLATIPRDSLIAFLGRAEVPAEMRAFFAARGIRPAVIEPPPVPPDDTGEPADLPVPPAAAADVAPGPAAEPTADVAAEPIAAEAAAAPAADGTEPPIDDAPLLEGELDVPSGPEGEDEGSTLKRVTSLGVAQRMKLAMKGSREERAILIRDPNKIVAVSVLSSPKLTESEVEGFAKMGSVSDEILRLIANTRAWVKNYQVVVALTKNAKTPLGVSMNLLPRLNERDLRMLSQDRNVPDVLRVTARKRIVIDK